MKGCWLVLCGPVLAVVVGLAGCSRGPVLSSPADDVKLGKQVAEVVKAEMGLAPDAELTRYIDKVGQRVAAHVEASRFSYTFQIVDQEAPNAFSVPGGHIYVSRGLLALLESEDELANVLGHEIVHVEARHAAQRRSAAILPGLFSVPGNVVGAVIHEDLGALLNRPVNRLGGAYLAGHSREHEHESDRVGQAIAARAGYDPEALATFLDRMDAEETQRVGEAGMPTFFDTHPATPKRVANARKRAADLTWTAAPAVAGDRSDFLRRLDGVMVGPNPAEGVFRGNRFLHPDLNFTLVMPAGWAVVNTRQAVGAVSPKQNAMLLLASPTTDGDPSEAADAFVKAIEGQGAKVAGSRKHTINGLPAHVVTIEGESRQGRMRIEVVWLAYNELLFQMVTLGPVSEGPVLRRAVDSFSPLGDADRRSVRELRLRVVEARAGETVASLGRRVGSTWEPAQTAVMNGLQLDQALTKGQLVKVALPQRYVPAKPRPATQPER